MFSLNFRIVMDVPMHCGPDATGSVTEGTLENTSQEVEYPKAFSERPRATTSQLTEVNGRMTKQRINS
ncbi:hypothetical protein TNCV_32211 [Trichonephila clavipes]|nr:hypothetical protein TNCV_32211 [Trichonephila clavipes]